MLKHHLNYLSGLPFDVENKLTQDRRPSVKNVSVFLKLLEVRVHKFVAIAANFTCKNTGTGTY